MMTLISNKKFRLHAHYIGWFGRKLYCAKDKVHWGYIIQIGIGPFCIFVDKFDNYNLAIGES